MSGCLSFGWAGRLLVEAMLRTVGGTAGFFTTGIFVVTGIRTVFGTCGALTVGMRTFGIFGAAGVFTTGTRGVLGTLMDGTLGAVGTFGATGTLMTGTLGAATTFGAEGTLTADVLIDGIPAACARLLMLSKRVAV